MNAGPLIATGLLLAAVGAVMWKRRNAVATAGDTPPPPPGVSITTPPGVQAKVARLREMNLTDAANQATGLAKTATAAAVQAARDAQAAVEQQNSNAPNVVAEAERAIQQAQEAQRAAEEARRAAETAAAERIAAAQAAGREVVELEPQRMRLEEERRTLSGQLTAIRVAIGLGESGARQLFNSIQPNPEEVFRRVPTGSAANDTFHFEPYRGNAEVVAGDGAVAAVNTQRALAAAAGQPDPYAGRLLRLVSNVEQATIARFNTIANNIDASNRERERLTAEVARVTAALDAIMPRLNAARATMGLAAVPSGVSGDPNAQQQLALAEATVPSSARRPSRVRTNARV